MHPFLNEGNTIGAHLDDEEIDDTTVSQGHNTSPRLSVSDARGQSPRRQSGSLKEMQKSFLQRKEQRDVIQLLKVW